MDKNKTLSKNKDIIKTKILSRKNILQRLTCLDDTNISNIEKGKVYYGIELEFTFKVYSEPRTKNKYGYSTYIGEYAKKDYSIGLNIVTIKLIQ